MEQEKLAKNFILDAIDRKILSIIRREKPWLKTA
jgi:hypothetical protein